MHQFRAGASIRLRNLNYYRGEIVDQMTNQLEAAIRFFQSDWQELDVNGKLDGKTSEKLRSLHDLPA